MRNSLKAANMALLTALLIVGVFLGYVYQMAPSPLFLVLVKNYSIYTPAGMPDYARYNLTSSVMFLLIIIASFIGAPLEQRFGPRNFYKIVLLFLAGGILLNYIASSFTLFLVGRAVFGVGFGLGLPLLGSAIMKWYNPRQREIMNSINGLFPFLGTVVSFGCLIPLTEAFGGNWKHALGIWGFLCLAVLLLWIVFIKDPVPQEVQSSAESAEESTLKLFGALWKRKEIKYLSIAFTCDFFCYAYIAAILPLFLGSAGHISETQAGVLAAIAFPAMGILGGIMGGAWLTISGRRKPAFITGQILKFVGICLASLGASLSLWLIVGGVALFGLGNSMWLPVMYNVITDLEDMTPTRVGAAFAFTSAFGFAAGVISPVLGGWFTSLLISASNITTPMLAQVYGLKWSLFAFGFLNLICLACALAIRETGQARRVSKAMMTLPEKEVL